MQTLEAPFSDSQVDQINAYQMVSAFSTMKCPVHTDTVLLATGVGLTCTKCSYLTRSCPEFIVSGKWRSFIQQVVSTT
mgnify:CR=1 FL=1